MKIILRIAVLLLLLVHVFTLTGCQHIATDEPRGLFINRYTNYIFGKVPDSYSNLKNPLSISKENIAGGKIVYQQQCVMCHGKLGQGNGSIGKNLVPHPANLSFTRKLPINTDSFLFWTISEGGKSLGTAMPAFKEQLTDDEIWQVSSYINSGFTN
ncbi:MAG: cytochrome c [Pseudomonadota bacterium]